MTISYQEILQDAQWFYGQAESAQKGSIIQGRFSTASVLFSFMALESFINNMMSDFTTLPSGLLTPHEQGFLAERVVEIADSGDNAGKFEVSNRQQYQSLERKIMFLVARFSQDKVDKGSTLWQKFQKMKDFRDLLTHTRKNTTSEPSSIEAEQAIEVAKDIIQLVSQKVWGKKVQF